MYLEGLALSGFRSFGDEFVYFDNLGSLNIIAGQNNCGKSNLLRFLSNVLPCAGENRHGRRVPLSSNDVPQQFRNLPLRFAVKITKETFRKSKRGANAASMAHARGVSAEYFLSLYFGDKDFYWHHLTLQTDGKVLVSDADREMILQQLPNTNWKVIWEVLRGASGGGLGIWREQALASLNPFAGETLSTSLIPAFRSIAHLHSSVEQKGGGLLPVMPSFMGRVCSGFAPLWGGLRTRLA